FPSLLGLNAPYVTPWTHNFSSPTYRNFPYTSGRLCASTHPSTGTVGEDTCVLARPVHSVSTPGISVSTPTVKTNFMKNTNLLTPFDSIEIRHNLCHHDHRKFICSMQLRLIQESVIHVTVLVCLSKVAVLAERLAHTILDSRQRRVADSDHRRH